MTTPSRRTFIKQIGVGTLGLWALPSLGHPTLAKVSSKVSLPRSTPELQGISSAQISTFLDMVATNNAGFHSIMIVRHGHVVAEGWWTPYSSTRKHTMYSLSKSFTSSAVGFAVTEGKLKVEDKVVSFFPDDVPSEISPNLAAMRVKDLLTMSTGHAADTFTPMRDSVGKSWASVFLSTPVEFEPGTHFLYNSGATYMLSLIVQKLTGQTVQEYLHPRLFDPLGIEGEDWEKDPNGTVLGATGLRIKTEDIAKFGLLYLQKGKFNGKQIIPEAWVTEATSKQVDSAPSNPAQNTNDSDWGQGYGYQFWRCTPGGYRGDGAFGQFCIVNPDLDLVIAATSESFDLQQSMRLMWKHILPGVKATKLAPAKDHQAKLKSKLASLVLAAPKGSATSPTASQLQGKEFVLDSSEYKVKAVSFALTDKECAVTFKDDNQVSHKVTAGWNQWKENKNEQTFIPFLAPKRIPVSTPIVASAFWSDDATLVMTLRYAETAHGDQLSFNFKDNGVTITMLNSIAKGNPKNPELRVPVQGKVIA